MKRLPRFVVTISASHALTNLATAMVSLATIWFVSGLSHRPNLLVELYVLLELPYLFFLIPSGRWVDGRRRYPFVILLGALRLAVMIGFAVWAQNGPVAVAGVIGFLTLNEITTAILQPARSAWTTELVPISQRADLAALNQGGVAIAAILGPAIGGFLYTRGRLGGVVGAAVGLMTLSWVIVLWAGWGREVRTNSLVPRTRKRQGFQFLRHHPGMLMMISFFALTNALNNVEAVLVPLLAHQVLHLASWEFGLLAVTGGGGALLGSGLIARLFRNRSMRWTFVFMGVFGSTIVVMGLARNLATLGVCYLLLGLSFSVTEVITSTLWQVVVPDTVRAEVMGALSTIARAANPAGYVLAGALDGWLGIRGGLVTGGLAIIALSLVMAYNRSMVALDHASASQTSGTMRQPLS